MRIKPFYDFTVQFHHQTQDAMRRGVLDEAEAKGVGKTQFNLQAPFRLSGLGQLAEASLTADRFVQF